MPEAANQLTDIKSLTNSIMAAAGGKPLDVSISAQKESQANAQLLLQFLIAQQRQEAEGGTGKSASGKPTPAGKSASAKPAPAGDRVDQLIQLLMVEQEAENKKLGSKSAK